MIINLSNVLSREGKVVEEKVHLEMAYFKSKLGNFKIVKKEPFTLTLTHIGNRKILVNGVLHLQIQVPCDRCLENVNTDFHFEISKELDMKVSDEDRVKDLDENSFVSGYELDTDKLIYNEILVNWPMKILCREDCKGICNRCGTNLNNGTCDCDTTVLDPRMSIIKDIFKNSKQ